MTQPLHEPERLITSSTRCDKIIPGDGVMSYHCILPQGHEAETSDPADPQPCWMNESRRARAAWSDWKQREIDRGQLVKAIDDQNTIACPACGKHAMDVDWNARTGKCRACGEEANFARTYAQPATEPGHPEDIEEILSDVPPVEERRVLIPTGEPPAMTSTATVPDPEIMAAAQQAAEDRDPLNMRDWEDLGEDVSLHTMLRMHQHGDGRSCHFHQRLAAWTFDGDKRCLRYHEVDGPVPGYASQMVAAGFGEENVPTKQRDGDQVLPAGGLDVVQDEIIAHLDHWVESGTMTPEDAGIMRTIMEESKRVGLERYGQYLKTFDGRLNIRDLGDELRDALVYVTKLQMTALADKEALVRMVTEAIDREFISGGAVDTRAFYAGAIAEVAVDRILDWVLTQKMGDQI